MLKDIRLRVLLPSARSISSNEVIGIDTSGINTAGGYILQPRTSCIFNNDPGDRVPVYETDYQFPNCRKCQ